ncbi:MAG: hypothetical protein KBB11_10835 [Bacteroidales bacterium]|nr:hypothetical protein [Bacteroidales bacterium]HOY38104.1 NosD domain-containing protein [Bacteroidales bacterium]HQP04484.1 NosD domain-containing protein [Bacteroidales bacterium]
MKLSIAFLLVLCSSYLYATTYYVTTTADAGNGSLRQAITSANGGPNNTIAFNIPSTDTGFDEQTGVFTIHVSTLLPAIQMINMTIDATTQPGNTNIYGPEICLMGNESLNYGLLIPTYGNVIKGFIINGFKCGVLIYKTAYLSCNNNTVSDCYLGVNYDGSMSAPNEIGIAIYDDATGNTIRDNLISGNTLAGIGIQSSNTNYIYGNRIGCDRNVSFAIPNYYGVAIDSSSNNIVGGTTMQHRNYISGNTYAGVAINSVLSHNNIVKGNFIGVNSSAIAPSDTLSNYYGVAINESSNNIIGGSTTSERNIISGNLEAGVAILGTSATDNIIIGNYIGPNADGTDSIANGNGILLNGANGTIIGNTSAGGGNVISGNHLSGISMAYSGTENNIVKGNLIGTDKTGMNALSNHTGIYLFSNANNNIIGGTGEGERNIISGNYELGISMEAVSGNIVAGNFIGPDISGTGTFFMSGDISIQGNGLYFNSNSTGNSAVGNLISGNRVYGLIYYGNSSDNSCENNFIGVDITGNTALPNATGICVDGAANHNPITGNVLSGNLAYGIFIVTTGTYYNELKGNKIGTNADGTAAVPNQIGLIIGGGAKQNIIGGSLPEHRNIISGNTFEGIEVADITTMYNTISGNYIGTDITGSQAIPNFNGIGFATRPSHNTINNNVISGNENIGVILYEFSDSNTVVSNYIGTMADGVTALGNGFAGVVIENSNHNSIGQVAMGNTIAFNGTAGLVVADENSFGNTFSANLIYSNNSMEIDLFPAGVATNDAGDSDSGANMQMNYPEITQAAYDPVEGIALIEGTIDNTVNGSAGGIRIEVFRSNESNPFQHGGADLYLGSGYANASGEWHVWAPNLTDSDKITATATDTEGNTSEFSLNSDVFVASPEILYRTNEFTIFPNPVNENVWISSDKWGNYPYRFTLTTSDGRLVWTKECLRIDKSIMLELGENVIPSGMYFLSIYKDGIITTTKKIAVIK